MVFNMDNKRSELRKHFKDEANKADSNKMYEERSAQLSSIEDTVANGIGALLNKDDNIGKLASAIDKLSMAKGDKGDPGKDGYTPIKGKDYYTNEEISQIADDIFSRVREPQDGEPGYTPVKGVDYYTDQEIRSMIEYIVSTIPKPKDGEDGKDAISPVIDYKKIITEVIKKIPKPKDGKPGKPGKDGKSSGGITGVMGLIAGAGITIDDTDRYYPIITSTGSGAGDVIAPATNTDSYIPQWDGADSKTLKNGLAVPAGGLAGLTALANYLPLTGGTLGTVSAGANLTVQGTLGTEAFTSFTVAGNWTLTAGWEATNDGGTRLNHNAAGTTSATFIGGESIVGTVYKVEFTMNASVTGGVKVYIGSQAESALYNPTISTPTTYTFYFTAITTTSLVFNPITTARFVITNISIKPVTVGTGELTNYGNILLGGKLKNPLRLSDNGLTIDTLGTVRVDGAFKTGGYVILGSSLSVATTITTTAGSITCTSGAFINIRNGAVTTSVDGLIESNSTASTAGVPVQMSPRIRLSGTVWDAGTTSSKTVNFKNEVLPISGNPGSGRLLWGYDYNGGGYTELMSLQSNGVFKTFQATTAAAPAYVKGGIYFDTTLNKLRVGGATAWETITSL